MICQCKCISTPRDLYSFVTAKPLVSISGRDVSFLFCNVLGPRLPEVSWLCDEINVLRLEKEEKR